MLEQMSCFYCPCFWESKVKRELLLWQFYGKKWNIRKSVLAPRHPPNPWLLRRFWVLNEAKNWAEGSSYSVSRSEESAFLRGFYYLVEERRNLLLPLAVGAEIKVLCGWAARANATVRSPGQKPPPKLQKKDSSKVVPLCNCDPQWIW